MCLCFAWICSPEESSLSSCSQCLSWMIFNFFHWWFHVFRIFSIFVILWGSWKLHIIAALVCVHSWYMLFWHAITSLDILLWIYGFFISSQKIHHWFIVIRVNYTNTSWDFIQLHLILLRSENYILTLVVNSLIL